MRVTISVLCQRRRQPKPTIQPMGSGFVHGPCSKGRTASGRGITVPVGSLILHDSWSWRIWLWASKNRSRARKKQQQPEPISAPRLTHIPSNDDRRSLPSRAEWAGRRVSEICWEAFIHLRVQESSLKKSANAILKVHENSVIQLIDIHNLSI